MLENEEKKYNEENHESEVKNESNIETVENETESEKTTEEMFEESDFVTPPQESEPEQTEAVQETNTAAQTDVTNQASESSQTRSTETSSENHIRGTEGASQYRYSYIQNHQKQDHVGGDHHKFEETPKQKKKHKHSMNVYAKVICCAILFGAISGGMILGSFMIGKNSTKTASP